MNLTERLLLLSGAILSTAAVMVASVPPATSGLLELDGNAVVAGTGDDWNLLNGTGAGGSNPGGSPGGSVARAFVAGPSSPSIFTTGGSKDPLDIPNWRWTTGSVPDKDQLTNGYAAAYIDGGTGESLLYFGADRFSQNADSPIGVWFFQDKVEPIAGGQFSGRHRDRDIFVISAFTGSGGTSTMTVYAWDHTCAKADSNTPGVGQCAESNLRVLFNSTQVCGSSDACAIVNNGPIPVSWPYAPKSGAPGIAPTGAFYEAGINLTQILAAQGVATLPCFTSFLEETRSSQSASATLKNFIAHGFPLCGLEVFNICPTCQIVNGGTAYQYTFNGIVHNKGIGSLYDVVITDDAGTPSDPSDDLTFNCGALAPNQTKTWGPAGSDCAGANTFNSTTQNPATNQAHASGQTSPGGGTTVSADSFQVTCTPCILTHGIAVAKSCTTALAPQNSLAAVRVDFSGSVQNIGTETLTNVNVAEDNNADGTIDVPSLPLLKNGTTCGSPCQLAPGETATFSGAYFPSLPAGTGLGKATFADTVTASGTGLLTKVIPAPATFTAHCQICPSGVCPP